MGTEKTMMLKGFDTLSKMSDRVYIEVVSNGKKISSETALRKLLTESGFRFNGDFIHAAESLGYISRKPYIVWKIAGPMTTDHIKKLMVRIHDERMRTAKQYKDLYSDYIPTFPSNVPDLVHSDARKEIARLSRTASGHTEEVVKKMVDPFKLVDAPKIVRYEDIKAPSVQEISISVGPNGANIRFGANEIVLVGSVNIRFEK